MPKDQHIYILAKYIARPLDPRQTSKPGYMKNPENIHYDEHVALTKGLKSKHRADNHVVLDITEQTVIKNTFNANRNFNEIFEHFTKNYESYIKNGVQELTGIKIDTNIENTPIEPTVNDPVGTAPSGMTSSGISSN